MAKKLVHVVYKVTDTELKKADSAVIKLGNDATVAQGKLNKMGKEGETVGKKMTGSFTSLKGVIATLGLTVLGKQIFEVTKEFEKLEAVLGNALGSKSAARANLKELALFAARTPFQVSELTASYIKLVNQGFKPTIEQLTSLGDLSASVGKGFDQLTEAIIDAQTGEFERLKEFGIRAKKQGDQVTFTFKGVKTQVDFTAESIQNYIVSLGELEGVTGTMATVSETLAGQTSNLGDGFDRLFNNIGKLNSGPISGFIWLMSKAVEKINEFIEASQLDDLDIAEIRLKRFRDAVQAAQDALKKGDTSKANQIFMDLTVAINDAQSELDDLNSESMKYLEQSNEIKKKNDALRGVLEAEIQGYKDLRNQIKGTVDEWVQKEAERLAIVKKAAAEEALWLAIMRSRLQAMRDEKAAKEQANRNLEDQRKAVDERLRIITEGGIKATDLEKKQAEDARKAVKEVREMQLEDEREAWRRRQDIYLEGVAAVGQILNLIIGAQNESTNKMEEDYNRQLALAGDNERRRKEIEVKAQKERTKMDEQEKKRRQSAAIKQIGISTAVNIVESIARNGGIPLGLPFGAIALALGIAQAATVRKYKDGKVDIDGPGTSTSDSIPARLSKGESVIKAESTRKSKGLLTLINDGKLNDKVMGRMKQNMREPIQFSDKNIVDAINDKPTPDYAKIAGDIYDVKQSKGNRKTLIRRKHGV